MLILHLSIEAVGNPASSNIDACSAKLEPKVSEPARYLGLPLRHLKLLVIVLLILIMVVLGATKITGMGHQVDALTNLRFAYNYFQHGVLSTDTSPPYLPSNAREPLPNIVTSFQLHLLSHLSPDTPFSYFLEGEGARAVKLVNLFWVALGLASTALLASELLRSFLLVLVTIILAGNFFFANPIFIDTLYTELQAAVLILLSSWCLLKAVTTEKKTYCLYSGVVLGLLALTKAVFFYIGCLLLVFVLIRFSWVGRKSDTMIPMRALAMIAGFTLALMPWMIRNKLQLGTFQLTQRGGRVMYTRANQNRMQNRELLGAAYFWGPSIYRHASSLLGFGAEPKDFQSGGRYQRINREESDFKQDDLAAVEAGRPQDVISYMRQTQAEITMLTKQAAKAGHSEPYRFAERQLGDQAKRMILTDPIRHITMTPLFLWRGIWSWPNIPMIFRSNPVYVLMKDLFAILAYLSMVTLFAAALFLRKSRYLAITVLPVGMLLFYGFLTHNIPRYSSPAIPMMIISLAVVLEKTADHFSLSRARERISFG